MSNGNARICSIVWFAKADAWVRCRLKPTDAKLLNMLNASTNSVAKMIPSETRTSTIVKPSSGWTRDGHDERVTLR
jgi:hypothetical protein